MKISTKYSLLILICAFSLNCWGQKKVSVTVNLPYRIDYSKLMISYNNGQDDRALKPIITHDTFTFTDSCFSRYATLTFVYPDSTETDGIPCFSFLVSGLSAKISFYRDSLKNKNSFRNYRLENASTLANIGESGYYKFIDTELKDAKNYYINNRDSIRLNKKYRLILDEKSEKRDRKTIEFIALNANQYYSLYAFKDIAQGSILRTDSLLLFYQQVFPDSLRQLYEGNEILKILKGRINNKKGGVAPGFKVKDIKGNIISLSDLSGKYVMLDFWASWCGPCIREMPKVKSLREKYSKENLEIMCITLDKNFSNFTTALKKINPDCTQVYEGSDLVKRYAVGPVPQVFLINKNGIIVYNRAEEDDIELVKLEKILEKAFENP
jgi:thiol-disulfide isomerase/thioredoxin